MVENLAAIGVKAEIASYDSATYFGVVMDASNFDISLFYLSAPSMLAVDIMGYLDFLPLGWFNDDAQGYKDMCVNARSLLDDAKRSDYMLELLAYFEQFHPWYPISEAVGASALNKDIGGAKYYLAGNLFYNDLYWN
ncbi:MAG: hypothetical protein MJ067_05530 [Oscillospiraceae bacterium]|nr:hypothetical protein [Oscillospiraceae bacterium]